MTIGELFSALTSDTGVSVESGVRYTNHDKGKLDVYRPITIEEMRPIVLFLYGGGWVSGERSLYSFVGSALAAKGITTVVPDYRLYPEVVFPAFVEDCAVAFGWVTDHLAQAGRPVIVAGHSAGAHIAALLALDPAYLNGPRPAGLVGLAGPYAFNPTTWPSTKEIFGKVSSNPDGARPIAFASSSAPPALLLHGAADSTVKAWNSVQLTERLRALSRPVDLLTFPGVGHMGLVLSIARPFRWHAPTLRSIVEFVRKI